MNYRIISADDHIDLQWLPKDLWQKRVPASWRDRAPTVVDTPEGRIRFVDTAGMRRRSRMDEGTEYYSLVRALQAIDRSEAARIDWAEDPVGDDAVVAAGAVAGGHNGQG